MFIEKKERRIIPRWRDFATTTALGQLDGANLRVSSLTPPPAFSVEGLKADWEQFRTVWHAADFVGAAFVSGKNAEAEGAARFLIENAGAAPQSAVRLARKMLPGAQLAAGPEPAPASEVGNSLRLLLRRDLRSLRGRLVEMPRDPVGWVDLARLYAIRGDASKADRAIRVALSLSPDNRFVLRSASRFYYHTGDLRLAHRILRQSSATARDPWLAAAELALAVATGAGPITVRQARSMLTSASVQLHSKTELASALATLELEGGKNRVAKRLFRESLAFPTENSVAQASWASERLPGLDVDAKSYSPSVPRNFEASAWQAFDAGEWTACFRSAVGWLDDQPFSSGPAVMHSYLNATIFENYELAIQVARTSLEANPGDTAIINNLAFSLASLGATEEADACLSQLKPQDTVAPLSAITVLATRGLILFRKGRFAEGRDLYTQAAAAAKKQGLERYRVLALLYQAREEVTAGTVDAGIILERAKAEAKGTESDKVVHAVASRISAMAASGARHPPRDRPSP